MFFERVTELCRKKGISLSAAAKEIGLSNSAITYWKKGAVPKSRTVQKLADYFGVTVDYLLGNAEAPPVFRFSHKSSHIDFDEQKILESAGVDSLDEIDIGFYGAYCELSEADKETVRQMVMFMRERRKKEEPPQE